MTASSHRLRHSTASAGVLLSCLQSYTPSSLVLVKPRPLVGASSPSPPRVGRCKVHYLCDVRGAAECFHSRVLSIPGTRMVRVESSTSSQSIKVLLHYTRTTCFPHTRPVLEERILHTHAECLPTITIKTSGGPVWRELVLTHFCFPSRGGGGGGGGGQQR